MDSGDCFTTGCLYLMPLNSTFKLVKSWLIGKDSDAGRDWGEEEKGTTEDEMDGWHHWLNGRESEWTLGAGDGQGGLACCNSWGRKELNMTEWLNWTEATLSLPFFIASFTVHPQCSFYLLPARKYPDKWSDLWIFSLRLSHIEQDAWEAAIAQVSIWGTIKGKREQLSLLVLLKLLCGMIHIL